MSVCQVALAVLLLPLTLVRVTQLWRWRSLLRDVHTSVDDDAVGDVGFSAPVGGGAVSGPADVRGDFARVTWRRRSARVHGAVAAGAADGADAFGATVDVTSSITAMAVTMAATMAAKSFVDDGGPGAS